MARKRKKTAKPQSTGVAKLKRDLLREGLVVDTAEPAPGEPKLSAALIDLLAPFAAYAHSLREYRMLISIGVTAWNLPLLKGKDYDDFYTQLIRPLLESGGEDLSRQAHHIFNTLRQRRQRLFASDKRLIVRFTVTDTGHEYHVAVATIRPGPDKSAIT